MYYCLIEDFIVGPPSHDLLLHKFRFFPSFLLSTRSVFNNTNGCLYFKPCTVNILASENLASSFYGLVIEVHSLPVVVLVTLPQFHALCQMIRIFA